MENKKWTKNGTKGEKNPFHMLLFQSTKLTYAVSCVSTISSQVITE